MRPYYMCAILLLKLIPSTAQVNTNWIKLYDMPHYDNTYFNDFVIDDSGFVYITGAIEISTGATYDLQTVKLDSSGVQVWQQLYDNPAVGVNGMEFGYFIDKDDSSNIYVTGSSEHYTGNRLATIKYNRNGIQQWVQTNNGVSYPILIKTDGQGNSYVIGWIGTNTYRLLKYDLNGNQGWTYQFTNIRPSEIMIDPAGYIYVSGVGDLSTFGTKGYLIKFHPGGSVAWNVNYANPSGYPVKFFALEQDLNLSVYAFGEEQTILGKNSPIIHKYDSSGTLIWSRVYPHSFCEGATDPTVPSRLFCSDTGGMYFASEADTGSLRYIIVAKYDLSGNLVWFDHLDLGNIPVESVNSVSVDSQNNLTIGGLVIQNLNLEDVLVVKYAPGGAHRWTHIYNAIDSLDDHISKVFSLPTGEIYAMGISDHMFNPSLPENRGLLIKYPECFSHIITNISNPSTNICLGDSILFESSYGSSYQWYRNSVLIAGATNKTYYASNMGIYKCYVTDSGGTCNGFTSPVSVSIVCRPRFPNHQRSGYEFDAADFYATIYPNPSSSSFFIDTDPGDFTEVAISIFDLAGREVKVPIEKYGTDKFEIPKLPHGIYSAVINRGNEIKILKLVQVE